MVEQPGCDSWLSSGALFLGSLPLFGMAEKSDKSDDKIVLAVYPAEDPTFTQADQWDQSTLAALRGTEIGQLLDGQTPTHHLSRSVSIRAT